MFFFSLACHWNFNLVVTVRFEISDLKKKADDEHLQGEKDLKYNT